MAKKKNSMALFEVVAKEGKSRNQPDLSGPAWMRGQHVGGPKPSQPPAAPTAPDYQATPAEAPEAAPEVRTQSFGGRQISGVEPMVSTDGGRLTVSLNYVSCTVAMLAILLLLIVAFMMGRASARPQEAPVVSGSVKAGTGLYAFSQTYINWPRANNDRIEVIADKPEYKVGDTAKLLIKSPYQGEGVKALITVER